MSQGRLVVTRDISRCGSCSFLSLVSPEYNCPLKALSSDSLHSTGNQSLGPHTDIFKHCSLLPPSAAGGWRVCASLQVDTHQTLLPHLGEGRQSLACRYKNLTIWTRAE